MKALAILFVCLGITASSGDAVIAGKLSPEIALNDPNGQLIELSSTRGDVVLIDFWASWCAPCRKKHPELVSVYKEFEDERFRDGSRFDIYSVSLDTNKERWIRAIDHDGLEWANHVSDLKGWKSEAAVTYGINRIPSNVLLDANGVVLGTNYSADELRSVLSSMN